VYLSTYGHAVLQACVKRVESDEQGQKHCTGQYFDYWGCIDQCVSLSAIPIYSCIFNALIEQ